MMRFKTPFKSLLVTTHAITNSVALLSRGIHGAPSLRRATFDLRAGRSRSMSDFTTSELKRLLSERGIDFRDCLEKGELVSRLQDALRGDGNSQSSSALSQLSGGEQSVVQLFQRVAPSVAFIQTSVVRQSSPLSMRGEITPSGSGSGFVWDAEGHVVTNYHVIQQAQKATVTGLGTGDAASMAAYDATLARAPRPRARRSIARLFR